MDVEAFANCIADRNVQLLDVRTAEEYDEGHIDGALLADFKSNSFMATAEAQLVKEQLVAVYCRSGRRSAMAAEQLTAAGYKCVNLQGGILAWQSKGKPSTTVQVDAFVTPGGKVVKLYALVHASIRMEYAGRTIVVDPVTRLGNRSIDYSTMPKASHILVTHEHPDHFDKKALDMLSDLKTQLVMNKRCVEMYGAGKAMVNGEKMQIADDITVEAVPAYNTTEGHLQFHPKGRDNGYILTLDGLRIYIAGDTEDIPEMGSIKDIDIAFLPCNQPYTMTKEQLVRAACAVKPKVLFPYHYGQTDVSSVSAQLQAERIDVRIRHYE
jgi:L-ascorbate metabolism protein UlaG (beta-lactamase superfamily)/rhodanese-related sulfurtransferase